MELVCRSMETNLGGAETEVGHGNLPLFRQEAHAARRGPQSGLPLATTPVSWRLLNGFLLAFCASALLFLTTQTIVRRETAKGVLALSLGEVRVVPPRAGVVTGVYVHEGDEVTEGQRLAYVSTAQYFITGGGLEAGLLRSIDEERSALRTQLQALDKDAPVELRGQQRRLDAEKHKLTELLGLLPTREERLRLSQRAYEQGGAFYEKGVLSGDALRERQYDSLGQQGETQNLRAQIAELEGSIARDEATLTELPGQQAKDRAEILSRIAALDQKQLNTTNQEGYLIVAKVPGHITALQVKPGQHADTTLPLMALIPRDSTLQAQLYVPSKAIAFARPGQRVRLMYDAFPYEQFGVSYGTIREISATVLKPDEIGAAVDMKEPAYRVTVAPDKDSVLAYGKSVPLRSGMALTADLLLEDRTFLALMLDPLRASGRRVLGGER